MENVDGEREAMRVFHLSAHVAGFVFFPRVFSGTTKERVLKRCASFDDARDAAKERTNDRDDDGKNGDDGARVARATRGGSS